MSYKDLNKIDGKIDKERIREKDSNALKVIESVFDFQTSMVLVKLMNKGIFKDISFVVSTGKEANVYHAYGAKKEEFAIKIYRTTTAEFKRNWIYVQGDPRFKKYKKGTYSFIYTWAKKEYKNLKRMLNAGIPVPKPEIVNKNILIMSFIGEKQNAAPLIREVNLKKPGKVYSEILDILSLMYNEANLVHADLSEYNILYFNNKPIIIDVSQAVLLDHPQAAFFLYRDVSNINRYFSSLGVKTLNNSDLFEQITGVQPNPKLELYEIDR